MLLLFRRNTLWARLIYDIDAIVYFRMAGMPRACRSPPPATTPEESWSPRSTTCHHDARVKWRRFGHDGAARRHFTSACLAEADCPDYHAMPPGFRAAGQAYAPHLENDVSQMPD